MARGNIFLGKARGRVGSVVFSKGKSGQQITRAYQSQVANPRTIQQMVQRGIFATVSTAGGILSDIVNHSFDGIAEGIDNRNEFVRVNSRKLASMARVDGPYSINANIKPKGASYMQPFEYQLSRGSLGDLYFGNRVLRTNDNTDDQMTGADLLGLFSNLKAGSQLTFIGLYEDYSTQPARTYRVRKCRLVFNDLITSQPEAPIGEIGLFYANALDVPRCDGFRVNTVGNLFNDIITIAAAGQNRTALQFVDPATDSGPGIEFNGKLVGWAVILTNYDASKADPWVHSTSTMAIDYDAWDDTNDNIATYGSASAEGKTSDLYLDRALPDIRGREVQPTLKEIVDIRVSTNLGFVGSFPYGEPVGVTVPTGATRISATIQLPVFFLFIDPRVVTMPEGWTMEQQPGGRTIILSGTAPTESLRFDFNFDVKSWALGGVMDEAGGIDFRFDPSA